MQGYERDGTFDSLSFSLSLSLSLSLQDGLELLNSHPELSPRGQLLSCKLSLMLSDASCLKATDVPKEMVQVFEGLTAMLSNQVSNATGYVRTSYWAEGAIIFI